MENLYPSGEWKGEKELGNDSRRLESRTKRSENLPKYIMGRYSDVLMTELTPIMP